MAIESFRRKSANRWHILRDANFIFRPIRGLILFFRSIPGADAPGYHPSPRWGLWRHRAQFRGLTPPATIRRPIRGFATSTIPHRDPSSPHMG